MFEIIIGNHWFGFGFMTLDCKLLKLIFAAFFNPKINS